MMLLKRYLRTWAFGIWLATVSLLVTAATCGDVNSPTVIEAEDDSTDSDTTEEQGFLIPAQPGHALV